MTCSSVPVADAHRDVQQQTGVVRCRESARQVDGVAAIVAAAGGRRQAGSYFHRFLVGLRLAVRGTLEKCAGVWGFRMARAESQAERREMVVGALLADASRSDRSLSRAFSVSHSTIGRVRAELVAAGRIDRRIVRSASARQVGAPNLAGARGEPGPALKHGALVTSGAGAGALQRRADELAGELRSLVPGGTAADEPLLTLLALTLARVEIVNAWLDQHGLFRNARGSEPQPILKQLQSWENAALRLCAELGLSPSARARLGVARAGVDAYQRYQSIVDGKGGQNGS